MKKYFYSHLITLDILETELDTLILSKEEKKELLDLAHQSIHHTVVDAILSHLSDEDKEIFLRLLAEGNHDKVWEHLNEKTDKIEDKIIEAAEEIKKQLHSDIKKIKGK
ncbi:MAG: hypothetical protein HYT08_04670 [Candidatus Levybacteria bacterium]|nr:hypothetical protein [Candidatus Levybacteria bacterium]